MVGLTEVLDEVEEETIDVAKDEGKGAKVDVETIEIVVVANGRVDDEMEGKVVDVWVGVDGAIVKGGNLTFNGVEEGVFSELNSENVG